MIIPRKLMIWFGGVLVTLIAAAWVLTFMSSRFQSPIHVVSTGRLTIIKNVRIFNGVDEGLSSLKTVILQDGLIATILDPDALAPHLAKHTNQVDPFIIEAEGKVLSPAFIDFHAHFGITSGQPPWNSSVLSLYPMDYEAKAYLHAGVTSVVSAGPISSFPRGMTDISPRIYTTGKIVTAEDGHPAPMLKSIIPWPLRDYVLDEISLPINLSNPNLKPIVDMVSGDIHHLKIVVDGAIPEGSPKLSEHLYGKVIKLAQGAGLPVYVHTAHPDDAVAAAGLGADVLMHIPYQAEFSDANVTELLSKGVPIVTTVQIWEWVQRGLTKNPPLTELEKRLMSTATRAALEEDWSVYVAEYKSEGFSTTFTSTTIPRFHQNLVANLKKLKAAGVPLFVGTDYGIPGLTPGASLIREMHMLRGLGFSSVEVLRMATSLPGEQLEPTGPALGVVVQGARAELILLPSNPVKNLSAIDHVEFVFSQGNVYQPAAETE